MHTCIQTDRQTDGRTDRQTGTRTHTHTHTHTHTYTHTQSDNYYQFLILPENLHFGWHLSIYRLISSVCQVISELATVKLMFCLLKLTTFRYLRHTVRWLIWLTDGITIWLTHSRTHVRTHAHTHPHTTNTHIRTHTHILRQIFWHNQWLMWTGKERVKRHSSTLNRLKQFTKCPDTRDMSD